MLEGEVLSGKEREELYEKLTMWYFAKGNGMLLTRDTREVYLMAKKNLVVDDLEVLPERARERISRQPHPQRDLARGELAMRQLSLLRTQMKADLAIYGSLYGKVLKPEDTAFLRDCGLNPKKKPWRSAGTTRRSRRANRASEP